jgi:two-component system catabolic regulation response regulator CreB/two-component system response regulator ChvI
MHAAKKRLLLVDDEKDITSVLHTALEESGFEVVSFNEPLLALQHFKPHHYNLVILDIKMPEMNGFELYRQIRRKDKRVKVCFLTAVSEFGEYEQYKKEAYPKIGERYFVAKPASNKELIRRINEMLT